MTAPSITISGQISVDDIKTFAQKGIKTIINNRPDGESVTQPKNADIAKACEDYGIAYTQIAFTNGNLSQEKIEAFADFLNQNSRPAHIFCRSGHRSGVILQEAIDQNLMDDEHFRLIGG